MTATTCTQLVNDILGRKARTGYLRYVSCSRSPRGDFLSKRIPLSNHIRVVFRHSVFLKQLRLQRKIPSGGSQAGDISQSCSLISGSLGVYLSLYIYTHIHTCIYIYIYIHVYVYVCTHSKTYN